MLVTGFAACNVRIQLWGFSHILSWSLLNILEWSEVTFSGWVCQEPDAGQDTVLKVGMRTMVLSSDDSPRHDMYVL